MKKALSALVVVVMLVVSLCSCQTASKSGAINRKDFFANEALPSYDYSDFRDAKWHMSVGEIKGIENGEPGVDTDTLLTYDVEVAGLACTAFYNISEEVGLLQGFYSFGTIDASKEDYIADYKTICDALVEKYGKASYSKDHKLSGTAIPEAYKGASEVKTSRWISGHNIIEAELVIGEDSRLFVVYAPFFEGTPIDIDVFSPTSAPSTDGL